MDRGAEPRLGSPDGFDDAMHRAAIDAFFAFFNPWCWWIDEIRFRQDMDAASVEPESIVRRGLRTANYSPMLHFAILAIGIMYLNHESGDREVISDFFARNAAIFFEEEIEMAKLSAVVGLLLLGSHHAGHSRPSLGYMYAGAGLRLTRIRE